MTSTRSPSSQRRAFLRQLVTTSLALSVGASLSSTSWAASALKGKLLVRWLGGGVVEIATPDYKQIAYADAWLWGNTGWDRFGVTKPEEYASAAGWVNYLKGKNPDAIFILLTHDHGDHMGNYLEMIKSLVDADLPVKTVGQSDLMRVGLVEDFKKAGLDPAKVIVNNGAGMNFGGLAQHGAMSAHLVPAVHSNVHGYPAAGYMLDMGGVRIYISGDTDLFGEMKTLGQRYHPDLALICVGGGPFTMGPEDAALACQWLGVSQALPVHYAHNPMVGGVHAGEAFAAAIQSIKAKVQVTVAVPGETKTLLF
jgi:L-ascorbate metabolism protein UlaG (beta-lactamase superfamily)